MSAIRNITIDQAANVQFDISVSDSAGANLDLTDYTITGSIKKHHESVNSSSFTTAGYANGIMRLSLSAVETANLAAGRYVYKTHITHNTSNTTTAIQAGVLLVRSDV